MVAVISFVCAFGAIQLNAELVLHWPFEEGSGLITADVTGNGHDGVLTNMDPVTDWINTDLAPIPGGTSAALDFDGVDDLIEASIDNYKGITGGLPRTVSAWINTTADNPPIVSWGVNATGQKYVFRVQNSNGTNGAIRVEIAGGYIVGAKPVNDGSWHHVAAVTAPHTSPDVVQTRLYVDGEIQGTSGQQSMAINTIPGANVRVGERFMAPNFLGRIDEVRIYDHALNPSEINALAGVTDAYADAVIADAPEAYWRFGENAGSRMVNEGSVMTYIDGTGLNKSSEDRYVPGLLSCSSNRALRFDGYDDRVTIPNHASINLSDVTNKTIECWFKTEAYNTNESCRVIYEQGGTAHGFCHYLELYEGEYHFRVGAWLTAGTLHTFFPQRVRVETQSVYHAVSTYSADTQLLVAYLNGACVASMTSINMVPVSLHSGDVRVGGIGVDARLKDFSISAGTVTNNSFAGVIDELATYNKDLSFERISF